MKKEIKIYLNPEEKERVLERAGECKLSLSSFCKKMVLNGQVYQLDAPPYHEVASEMRQSRIALKTLLLCIYRSGAYQKEDLAQIQAMIDQLTEAEKHLSGEFQKYAQEATRLLSK